MRAFGMDQVRILLQYGDYEVLLPQHGQYEQVGSGTLTDQVAGDIAVTYMSCSFYGFFKVSPAPVMTGIQQVGGVLQHFFYTVQVAVPGTDELFYDLAAEGRIVGSMGQ